MVSGTIKITLCQNNLQGKEGPILALFCPAKHPSLISYPESFHHFISVTGCREIPGLTCSVMASIFPASFKTQPDSGMNKGFSLPPSYKNGSLLRSYDEKISQKRNREQPTFGNGFIFILRFQPSLLVCSFLQAHTHQLLRIRIGKAKPNKTKEAQVQ